MHPALPHTASLMVTVILGRAYTSCLHFGTPIKQRSVDTITFLKLSKDLFNGECLLSSIDPPSSYSEVQVFGDVTTCYSAARPQKKNRMEGKCKRERQELKKVTTSGKAKIQY